MTDGSPTAGPGAAPTVHGRDRSVPGHGLHVHRRFDRANLRDAIAHRRAQLADLEASMVAACESAAARGAAGGVRIDDRATWDRATWDRYLAEAARLEPDYVPTMLRLLTEISRLERLALLCDAMEPAACNPPN